MRITIGTTFVTFITAIQVNCLTREICGSSVKLITSVSGKHHEKFQAIKVRGVARKPILV
jgi:hypothetical protein